MTVRELYRYLDAKIPRTLSYEWDNDGLMCCPDGEREVRRVLVALDVTGEVVDIAVKGEYDAVISHHPFIFKGLKSLDDVSPISAKAMRLIESRIAVMSFHTRLDCVHGGVNDRLCKLLGIYNTEEVRVDGLPLGRIGELPTAETLESFAEDIKDALEAPALLVSSAGVDVKRVCVVGGSGGDALSEARRLGADTFVSGRVGYHEMTDGGDFIEGRINIIEAGHFYTENPVCEVLLDMVCEADGSIECDIVNSNSIKLI